MTASIRRLPDRCRRAAAVAASACLAVALVTSALGAAAPPAFAQDTQIRSLIDRIDRLQRELSTLQRQIYRGEPPPAPAGGVSARGVSVEGGGLSNTAAARIQLRLSQFEAELRSLTGQVEEATFRNNQLRKRLDRLTADVDLRFQQLAPGVAGVAGAPGAPAGTGGQASFGTGPRVLGTISQSDLDALQSQPVGQGTGLAQPGQAQPGQAQAAAQPGARQTASLGYALAGETPAERYKHAFGLLSQANYGEAELALRAFVEQHRGDPLAGNAKYWLGETYYVRQDYQQAAVTFAEAYQEYPNNSKAPDNLLKLGMSLAALGSKPDACGTFAELMKRYPDAAATVIQRAKQEQKRLACP